MSKKDYKRKSLPIMARTIKAIKTAVFVISLIELISLLVFTIFYFGNILDIQNHIQHNEIIVLGAIVAVLINCLFMWIVINYISHLRRKIDLTTADLVGGDIKQAYSHAELGLLVTDKEDTIIWANDLFMSRGIQNKIDEKIVDAIPETADIINNPNQSVEVEAKIGEQTYSVKHIREAGLWMFKDISDYKFLNEKYTNEKPVVGVLSIDNYDEVVSAGDDFNDSLNRVKTIIDDYTKKFGILLRKLTEKKYSMFFNVESLEKIKKDNFSILSDVRRASGNEALPLTISIGIAYEYPDVIKLNDLANDALGLAMARGGDQIVLNNYTGNIEYIGGNTESKSSQNSVKYRVTGNTLVELIQKSSNVLVMGHMHSDMDSLGASLGMKAICDRVDVECEVVIDLEDIEEKTSDAIYECFSKSERDKIFISPKNALDKVEVNTLLIVVDVSNPMIVIEKALLDKTNKIVVVDHHRKDDRAITDNVLLSEIDASASSTCEIVTEFIEYIALNPRVSISPAFATIMLAGITMDTQNFKSPHCGFRTFEAASILNHRGGDNVRAINLLKDDLDEYNQINNILRKVEHQRTGTAIVAVDEPDPVDPKSKLIVEDATISKVADRCLELKDIHASFVIAPINDKTVKLSARSDGTINVETLVRELGGGGHKTMAAAKFDRETVKDVRERLLNTLDRKLADAMKDIGEGEDK